MTRTSFSELINRGSLIVNDGYRTKKSELTGKGIPILRVAEVGDGFLTPKSADRISEDHRFAIGAKLSEPGDVLLTTKGTVGRRAIVPQAGSGFAYSPQLCFFRVLDDSIDRRWLYYWLGGPEFWRQAVGVSTQTDMAPYISLRDLRAMTIVLPPLAEQRAIAATLGAFDDKIESNRRVIALALKRTILELNTGAARVRLGDVATINKGLSYKGSGLDDGTSEGATPMLNLASFTTTGELKSAGTKWYTGDFKPRHRLDAWDLVIANTDLTQAREILGRGFLVPPKYEGAIHTHHTSVVRFSEQAELAVVLWAQIQSAEFRDRARGFATGTTVAALPPEAALDFELTIPADLSGKLATAHRLIERVWQLEDEIGKLKGIRDFILPELFSGRLRVSTRAETL